jgi:membrane-bound ClpP family serine protease
VCVITWNGSLAVTWLVLALYRMHQTGSGRFAVVFLFGLANLLIVGRLVVPGRGA